MIEQVVGDENAPLCGISYFPWMHSIDKIRAMIAEAGFESMPIFEWSEELPRYSWDDVRQKAWEAVPPLQDTDQD